MRIDQVHRHGRRRPRGQHPHQLDARCSRIEGGGSGSGPGPPGSRRCRSRRCWWPPARPGRGCAARRPPATPRARRGRRRVRSARPGAGPGRRASAACRGAPEQAGLAQLISPKRPSGRATGCWAPARVDAQRAVDALVHQVHRAVAGAQLDLNGRVLRQNGCAVRRRHQPARDAAGRDPPAAGRTARRPGAKALAQFGPRRRPGCGHAPAAPRRRVSAPRGGWCGRRCTPSAASVCCTAADTLARGSPSWSAARVKLPHCATRRKIRRRSMRSMD